jgi:hypothetical protein
MDRQDALARADIENPLTRQRLEQIHHRRDGERPVINASCGPTSGLPFARNR